MMNLPQSRELPLLLLWVLLLGPLLSSLAISLLPAGELSAPLELGKIILSSLLCFALPSLFFPSGRKARQTLFHLQLRPSTCRYPRLRLLAVALGSLLLAEGLYLLFLRLSYLIDYHEGDLITERLRLLLLRGEASVLWSWIALALVPALTEELLFRGMLQPLVTALLPERHRHQLPLLITALLFSLLHLSPLGFASRFVLGYALSFLARETRGLGLPILLHLTNNTLALLTLFP